VFGSLLEYENSSMAKSRLTVVLSQGQSQNPAKRGLEEEIAAALIMEPGIEVSVIPNLYDLHEGHTGLLYLRSVPGDMVVLSWLFGRAAHWELDRVGVKGNAGTVLLKPPADDDEEDEENDAEAEDAESTDKKPTLGALGVPDRRIYCLDLRDFDMPQPYLEEIRRIAAESRVETVSIQLGGGVVAAPEPADRGASDGSTPHHAHGDGAAALPLESWIQGQPSAPQLARFLDPAGRRWHPVIDYNRCTNCLECIDFCLFGVYGVDTGERILVDQPDNCKKGCPACSRVCPEHAIIFPMHKTPEIAGAPGGALGGLKIDLSRLFGGPNAFELAAQERDTELVRDGREAVGLSVGIPKRQAGKPAGPKDDLDKLVDELDALDI
jgi:Pyruvate/2-oxoacid:ferredoxin oxidoreductase delta subunit